MARLGVSTFAFFSAALAVSLCLSAYALGGPLVKPVGWGPLTSKEAAKRVKRSDFEPRPSNSEENQTRPTAEQIAEFRAQSDMPYAGFVDGRFRGTTDEIIQWAAKKWGFHPDLFRAVARYESYWDMNTLGDSGDSFGLFQVRRPYHCCLPYMRDSTAFNADYYGGITRAYFDGQQDWLNNPDVAVNNIGRYVAGDLWGSIGAWVTGNWHVARNEEYVETVKGFIQSQPWRNYQYFAEPWYEPLPE
ncbi:MAG: hypothetical protein ACR2OC_02260 [Solirubrobacterales bacterium]